MAQTKEELLEEIQVLKVNVTESRNTVARLSQQVREADQARVWFKAGMERLIENESKVLDIIASMQQFAIDLSQEIQRQEEAKNHDNDI